ncbi:MAG: alpha/beta hydrolase [Reichenbachiella sp.]|uniref:alpha/beta fold hydrolase n=1 Tax=Reichenbachiella sp. TaxID=2184521 RepID=UPI003267AB46
MHKLVMIPGTLCNESLFRHQVEYFKHTFELHVVDSSSRDTLHDQAKAILEQVPGKFILMGLSYGAIIAFEIIRQASNRLEKLIILNSNYKIPSDQTRANFARFEEMTRKGRFQDITSDYLLPLMLYPSHSKIESLSNEVIKMADSVGVEGFRNQMKAQLSRPDSSQTLKEVVCPTLIIAGAQDKVCPVAWHQEMHEMIPGSKLEIIEQCGHLSTMERPEKINQTITNWI